MITLDDYFAFDSEPRLAGEALFELLTEQRIVEAGEAMLRRGEDESNVYFKLLAQLIHLEQDIEKHRDACAHLNYLIGYYVGLFLHPCNGDQLAFHYLNRSMAQKNDVQHLSRCLEVIRAIEGRV